MDKRFMPEGCELESIKKTDGSVYITVKRLADGLFFCCGYKESAPAAIIKDELVAFRYYVDGVRLGGHDFSQGEGEPGQACKVDGKPGFTVWMVDDDERVYGVKLTAGGKRAKMRKVPFKRVQWDDGRQVA